MKSKGVAYLLCILFGWLGFHRFYIGKIGTGVLYFLTLGFMGIGILIDLFTLARQVDDYNVKYIALHGGQNVNVQVTLNQMASVRADVNGGARTVENPQSVKQEARKNGETTSDDAKNSDVPEIPYCREIVFSGTSEKLAYAYSFRNEMGFPILFAYADTHLLFPEFNYTLDETGFQTIMTSKTEDGNTSVTQTATDKDGNLVGTATINGSIARSFKTIITIRDKDGAVIMLQEDTSGLFKKIGKLLGFFIPSYGIGHLFDTRTGNMFITKNGVHIGIIESKREATRNSYIVRNCDQLRKQLDLRLIILGLTLKSSKTK